MSQKSPNDHSGKPAKDPAKAHRDTDLKPADQTFIDSLKVGDRLFHFPGYTLYSVIDIPDEKDITLMGAFDQKESRKNFSRDQLLSSGDWWYNPAG